MKKILALILISCFLLPQMAFGGAWTVPKGDIWMQQQIKWIYGSEDFGPENDRRKLPRDAKSWGWNMIPEFQFGAADWLNILFRMEYKQAWYKEYNRPNMWGPYSVKNHGLVTIDPGLKIRLMKEPVVLSLQMYYSIWNPDYEVLPLMDVAEQPGLTDRTNYFEIKAQLGKKWDTKIPFYTGFETGYRFNVRNVTNQVPLFWEFGFWPWKPLLIKTEIDCMFSHDKTRTKNAFEKSWAIWRIGPNLELITLWDMLTGKDVTTKDYENSVTRAGKSLNLECQYGYTFYGKQTTAFEEIILKVAMQF